MTQGSLNVETVAANSLFTFQLFICPDLRMALVLYVLYAVRQEEVDPKDVLFPSFEFSISLRKYMIGYFFVDSLFSKIESTITIAFLIRLEL